MFFQPWKLHDAINIAQGRVPADHPLSLATAAIEERAAKRKLQPPPQVLPDKVLKPTTAKRFKPNAARAVKRHSQVTSIKPVLRTFTCFKHLPIEIRVRIWGYVACNISRSTRRFVSINANNPAKNEKLIYLEAPNPQPVSTAENDPKKFPKPKPQKTVEAQVVKALTTPLHILCRESRRVAFKSYSAYAYTESNFAKNRTVTKLVFNDHDVLYMPCFPLAVTRILVPTHDLDNPFFSFGRKIRRIVLNQTSMQMLMKRRTLAFIQTLASFQSLRLIYVLVDVRGEDDIPVPPHKCQMLSDKERAYVRKNHAQYPPLGNIERMKHLLDQWNDKEGKRTDGMGRYIAMRIMRVGESAGEIASRRKEVKLSALQRCEQNLKSVAARQGAHQVFFDV